MDTLGLDQAMYEIIPRPAIIPSGKLNTLTPSRPITSGSDDVTAALDLVSETAAAIRELEKQSAQAVARAHNVANAVREELERTETRAERAEETLRLAKVEVEELISAIAQSRRDVEMLQSQLAAKEGELAASERRANDSERRGEDANAAMEKVIDAIRSQLPVKLSVEAE